MDYTKKLINRTFLIKVRSEFENRLVGVDGLIERIGLAQSNKFLHRAFACMDDKCRCKVYGTTMTVTFYYH